MAMTNIQLGQGQALGTTYYIHLSNNLYSRVRIPWTRTWVPVFSWPTLPRCFSNGTWPSLSLTWWCSPGCAPTAPPSWAPWTMRCVRAAMWHCTVTSNVRRGTETMSSIVSSSDTTEKITYTAGRRHSLTTFHHWHKWIKFQRLWVKLSTRWTCLFRAVMAGEYHQCCHPP